MTVDRKVIKDATIGLLSAIAQEHPLGHQPNKAARFTLKSQHGVNVEVMFEKDDHSPPNLWCLEKAAGAALVSKLRPRSSPARLLRTTLGSDGRPQYGRHSSLERMKQLGDADLVCFSPQSLAELGEIIDRLRSVTAADLL